MPSQLTDSSPDLKAHAASCIGQIVLVMSQIELNLVLLLRNLASESSPRLETATFKEKLDLLQAYVEANFAPNSGQANEFLEWHDRATAFRLKRNEMVHGRWGFAFASGHIINLLPASPNTIEREERRYSASELDGEVEEAEAVSSMLCRLAKACT